MKVTATLEDLATRRIEAILWTCIFTDGNRHDGHLQHGMVWYGMVFKNVIAMGVVVFWNKLMSKNLALCNTYQPKPYHTIPYLGLNGEVEGALFERQQTPFAVTRALGIHPHTQITLFDLQI